MCSALPGGTPPPAGLWIHFPGLRARAVGTHRLVGGFLLPASLPHSQVEGVLHTGLQALPRDGDYAVSTGSEVQHTAASLTLWPTTGAVRPQTHLKTGADPKDSWGHPSPCWDQAHQDSASRWAPSPWWTQCKHLRRAGRTPLPSGPSVQLTCVEATQAQWKLSGVWSPSSRLGS